jgi:hypothetical protein
MRENLSEASSLAFGSERGGRRGDVLSEGVRSFDNDGDDEEEDSDDDDASLEGESFKVELFKEGEFAGDEEEFAKKKVEVMGGAETTGGEAVEGEATEVVSLGGGGSGVPFPRASRIFPGFSSASGSGETKSGSGKGSNFCGAVTTAACAIAA